MKPNQPPIDVPQAYGPRPAVATRDRRDSARAGPDRPSRRSRIIHKLDASRLDRRRASSATMVELVERNAVPIEAEWSFNIQGGSDHS
jgi:hypothetical protein